MIFVYPEDILTFDELKKILILLKYSDEELDEKVLESLGIREREARILARKVDLLQTMLDGELPEGPN